MLTQPQSWVKEPLAMELFSHTLFLICIMGKTLDLFYRDIVAFIKMIVKCVEHLEEN